MTLTLTFTYNFKQSLKRERRWMGTFENWTDSWTCDDDESGVIIDPIVKNIDCQDFNSL